MKLKKIKIAFVIDQLDIGGTEKQLVKIIDLLDKDRFEVILICLRPSQYFHKFNILCKKNVLNVYSLISIQGFKQFIKFSQFLKKENIDIVQTFFFDSSVFAVLSAKLAGVKKIICCRRDMGFWYNTKLLAILKLINFLVDGFIVNSCAVKELVSKKELVSPENIKVISNGIDLQPFRKSYDPKDIKKSMGISLDDSVVGIIANLNREVKRVDLFIRAASRVLRKEDKVSFVIVGGGHLRSGLETLARTLGVQGRIFFAGLQEDIFPYLSVFDIGVISSDSEGFSNSIIEYAALGIPVIATDVGGNREILSKGDIGELVPVGNDEKMAKSIVRYLNDPSKVEKISTNAEKMIKKEYAWTVKIKEIEQFYEEILEVMKKGI